MTDFDHGFKIAVTIGVAYMAIWWLVSLSGVVPDPVAEAWHDRFMAGLGALLLIGALIFVWGGALQ